jgi:membrane-bound lytic murein transglycosylase F
MRRLGSLIGVLLLWLVVACSARPTTEPDAAHGAATSTTATATTAMDRAVTSSIAVTSTTAALGSRPMTTFEQELMRHSLLRYAGDLDTIRAKKVLRVLTRNNSSSYFVANGQERGFQYELAKSFADSLGVRLTMIVPASRSELEEALLAGEGDLIAAGTTITSTRAARLHLSPPLRRARRVVVVPAQARAPRTPAELRGLPIHVSFRSTTADTLRALEPSLGFALTLVDVEDDVEMEEMITRVAAGDYPATLVDEDIVALAIASGAPVKATLSVGEPLAKGWVVRPDAPQLAAAVDAFVNEHARGGLVKIYYDRYFKRPRGSRAAYRADRAGRISRWDELFQAEARAVGMDWRLLAAIAFAESRFDPTAHSPWGAVGLMQVLPSTAREHGIEELTDPAQNIRAGARYYKYLVDRFDDPSIELRQRLRFALAAYNAGLGHVLDARELATRTSRNPSAWFGQVEEALRLKKDRRWHEQTRFGYCRADETIDYVSRVQAAFDVFARHVPAAP